MAAIYLTIEHARWFDMARRMMESGVDPLSASWFEWHQIVGPCRPPVYELPEEYRLKKISVNPYAETDFQK